MATIEWINHAGFVVRHGAVALACDPWLDGPAFQNGWALLAPTALRPADFAAVTHIWFSHEHPDHFSPKNLREIPEEVRRRLTVLFQTSRDRKVVKFCEGLGFQVRELEDGRPVELGPEFTVTSQRYAVADEAAGIDSYLVIGAGGRRLFNLNDYIVSGPGELRAIRERYGPLDVLLTQFSYANWVGNPDDRPRRARAAADKLAGVRRQVEILQPTWAVPFASFVWFAHAENFYMNDGANDVRAAADVIAAAGATPVVLYPGDVWEVGAAHDPAPALARYAADAARVREAGPLFHSAAVDPDRLAAAAAKHVESMRAAHGRWMLRLVPGTVVFVTDLGKHYRFDYQAGLREVPAPAGAADVTLAAESLLNCFTTPWGESTLNINGRYTEPRPGRSARFFRALAPARYAGAGLRLTPAVYLRALARFVRHRLGPRVSS